MATLDPTLYDAIKASTNISQSSIEKHIHDEGLANLKGGIAKQLIGVAGEAFAAESYSLLTLCGVSLKATVAGDSRLLAASTRQGVEREGKIMGADVSIYLFDVKTFDERIFPAYQAFAQKDNPEPLIALLREVIQKFDRGEPTPYPEVWQKEKYEECIGILDGTIGVSPEDVPLSKSAEGKDAVERKRVFVRRHLIYPLAFTLCLPRIEGVNPRQDLSNTRLVGYLGCVPPI